MYEEVGVSDNCVRKWCVGYGINLEKKKVIKGKVAPMVERRAEDPCVGGSSPSLTTRSNAAVVQLVEQVLAGVMI